MVPSPPCETPARFLEAVHGVRDHGVTLMGQPDRCYGRSTHRVIATLPPGAYPAGVMADGKLPIADVTNYGDGHTAGAVSVIEPARTTTNAIPLGGRPGAWRQTQLLTPCT